MSNSFFWYIASYPKSGNTWCRIFISELIRLTNKKHKLDDDFSISKSLNIGESFSCRSWIDDQIGINSSDLRRSEIEKIRHLVGKSQPIFSNQHRYHKVHDAFSNNYTKDGSTVCVSGCKGAIYIVRNPFDVCISFSKFMNLEINTSIKIMTNEEYWLNSSFTSYTNHVSQFLGSWDNHVKSWLDQKNIPVLLIRYEDLLSDPLIHFSKISKFLNISENKEIISKAISNTSFSNLKNKELEGGFIERPKNCKEFFRKGISGEGIRLMKRSQINKLKKKFYKSLLFFDYL